MSTTKTATSYKLSLASKTASMRWGQRRSNPHLSAASSWTPPMTNALLWPTPQRSWTSHQRSNVYVTEKVDGLQRIDSRSSARVTDVHG